MAWLFLTGAIAFEIVATTLMKVSDGFSKLLPTVETLAGYIISFTLLSFALKKIDMGVAYAVWAAAGIVILSTIGIVVFKETVSVAKVVSIVLIVIGVVGLNLSGVSH